MNTSRRFSRIVSTPWLRAGAAVAVLAGVGALVYPLFAALGDYDIAQEPLYSKKTQPPLMMMVMSVMVVMVTVVLTVKWLMKMMMMVLMITVIM